VPAVFPLTVPEEETEAVDGALLLQVPPAVATDKAIEVPVQTLVGPDIAPTEGTEITDIDMVRVVAPQPPLTT